MITKDSIIVEKGLLEKNWHVMFGKTVLASRDTKREAKKVRDSLLDQYVFNEVK
jgi:hypothetical protein